MRDIIQPIFLIIFISLSLSGCVSDERSIEEIAESANSLFLKGQYDYAVEEYSALINKINVEGILVDDYEMSSIYLMRGIGFHHIERYDSAVKDYSSAISFDSKNVEAYVARAQAYSSLGKESLMNEDIKKAKELGFNFEEEFGLDYEEEFMTTEDKISNEGANEKDNFKNNILDIPDFEYTKEFNSLKLSSEKEGQIISMIELADVKEVSKEELSGLDGRDKLKEDYQLSGAAFEINIEELTESEKADLKEKLYITIEIPKDYLSYANADNAGAIYYSPKGPIYMKGALSDDGKSVIIPTTHLSLYELVFGKPTKKAEDIIKAEAKKYAYSAGSYIENQIIEGIKNNQFLLDLDDDIKSKVLNNVMANKDKIAELAAIAGGDESIDAGKSISLLVGKLIVDNMDEDNLKKAFGGNILKNLVDKADLVGELADAAGKEDYMAAVEAIGKNIANELMIVKATKAGAAAWDAAIKAWEDGKNEQLYQEWLSEEGSSDFWEDSYNKNGYSSLYRQYAIKNPECSGDGSRQCVEKLFKSRKSKEELIAKEEQKLKQLHDYFEKENNVFLRGDLEKQMVSITGDKRASKTMVFEFFIKNMKEIELELKSLGIEEPAWNKHGLSKDAYKLIIAYSEGGKSEKLKALKELQLREAKKLKFKKCVRDSDCEKGFCSEEYNCVECLKDEHCGANNKCIDNKCEKVAIQTDTSIKYGLYRATSSHITASVLNLNCPYEYNGKQRIDFDGFFRTSGQKISFKSAEFDLVNNKASGTAELEYDCTSFEDMGMVFKECQYDKGTYSVSYSKGMLVISYQFQETEISGTINADYDSSLGC